GRELRLLRLRRREQRRAIALAAGRRLAQLLQLAAELIDLTRELRLVALGCLVALGALLLGRCGRLPQLVQLGRELRLLRLRRREQRRAIALTAGRRLAQLLQLAAGALQRGDGGAQLGQ